MNAMHDALANAGLVEATTAPEYDAPVRDELPAEVLDKPIQSLEWGFLAANATPTRARVYFKTGRASVRRVMDVFTVNNGHVVEARFQGDTEFRSFDATATGNFIVVSDEPDAEAIAKAAKASERKAKETARRARQLARSKGNKGPKLSQAKAGKSSK